MSMCENPKCVDSPSGFHEFDRSRSTKCMYCGCSSNESYCSVTDRCPMGGVHTVSDGEFGKCKKCGCSFSRGGRKSYKFRRTKKTKRRKNNKRRKTTKK